MSGKRLLARAKLWAEKEIGPGSVFRCRRDIGEAGLAVVDVLVAPVRQTDVGRHHKKPTILTANALAEIETLEQQRTWVN